MKANRWVVWAVCAGLFLSSMLFRSSNAVIAPELSRDLGLTAKDISLLGAAFFYVFAPSQLPLGFFLDRFGPRRTMIVLNLIGVLACVIFARAESFTAALLGRALIGLGMCANLMGSFKLFTNWFKPAEFGAITGLTIGVGYLGGVLASTPLVLLVEAVTWRGAFYILAGGSVLLTLGLILLVSDRPPAGAVDWDGERPAAPPAPISAGEAVRRLLKNRSYWLVSIAAGLRYGAYGSIQTLWAGPFFMVYLGFSPVAAGNLLLMINLGFIAGAPLSGWYSDRVLKSRKKAVFISLASLTVLVFILSHWPGPVWYFALLAMMFILGFMASFGQLIYAHVKELMPAEMAGRAMSGTNFFTMIGAALFLSLLGGVLGEEGDLSKADYYPAFILCGGTLLLATVVYAFSRERREKPAD